MIRAVAAGLIALAGMAVMGAAPAPKPSPKPSGEPFYQAVGDHSRSYVLKASGETRPYRIYVPTSWKPGMHLPLVLALHGAGSDQNRLFVGTPAHPEILQKEAEAHGYIVVAPLGDSNIGSDIAYGNTLKAPWSDDVPPSAADAERNRLSEADVLAVLDRTVKEYGADRGRLYIIGNSMGEIGGLWLVLDRKRPWCAVALAGGPLASNLYPYARARGLSGVMIINGDEDLDAMPDNRKLADGFKAAGFDTQFYVAPFSVHGAALFHALPQAFDFFDGHRCG